MWTAEDDKWNAEKVALMEQWVKGSAAAFEEAKSKGIEISSDNQEWIDLRAKHCEGIPRYSIELPE